MKITAVAPANIAFIKYWGKKDEELRLPLNSSISMNLTGAHTTTTVEFSETFSKDTVEFVGETASEKEISKIITHLDRIRAKAHMQTKAKVVTKNSFPKGAGAAASASGFAALTVAAARAAGLALSEKELSILARIGSGSACRSIPNGFVMWEGGTDSDSSYAYSLYPSTYWDLRDLLVIVDKKMKKISTTAGMEQAHTSPFLKSRLEYVPMQTEHVKKYLAEKNFQKLGECIETESTNMHAVMMTQNPPLFYWSGVTLDIMHAVTQWRTQGLPVYFTIDAGPNVHLICEGKNVEAVLAKIKKQPGVVEVIENTVSPGTHIIDTHLF